VAERVKRRGRRRTYDADGTRAAITAAAASSFAEHGYHGVSVDTIANLARCNKSLVFQYFGSKEALYTAVLADADEKLAGLLERSMAPILPGRSPGIDQGRFTGFLRSLLGAFFDYVVENPQFARIMAWEQAAQWKVFRGLASRFEPRDLPRLEEVFDEARRAGHLRGGVDSVMLTTLALQMCWTVSASIPLYEQLLPVKERSQLLAHLKEQIVDLLAAGALRRGTASPSDTRP